MARQARDNSRDRDSVKQEKRQDRDGTRQLIVLLPVNINVSVTTISLSQMHRQEHQLTNLTVSTQCNTTQHN